MRGHNGLLDSISKTSRFDSPLVLGVISCSASSPRASSDAGEAGAGGGRLCLASYGSRAARSAGVKHLGRPAMRRGRRRARTRGKASAAGPPKNVRAQSPETRTSWSAVNRAVARPEAAAQGRPSEAAARAAGSVTRSSVRAARVEPVSESSDFDGTGRKGRGWGRG
jgi:hypothetical protein